MHTPRPPLTNYSPRHPLRALMPPAPQTQRHHTHETQGRRDWEALEILRLAGSVFWEGGGGDVEAREAGQTAQEEEGEEEGVEGGAQAEGVG